MDTLESERLVLRAWTMDDLDAFNAYAKHPDVGPPAGWKPHESLAESREILKEFIEKDDSWAIALREKGRLAGAIGMHKDVYRPDIRSRIMGYTLAADQWGKGYATEAVRRVIRHAFDDMGLEAITIGHFPSNAKSRRVIEKCGFVREGTLRRIKKLPNGSFTDSVMYSMLREEYLAHREDYT